jgi:hypothetical protein
MKNGSFRSGSGLAALAGIACIACCALPVLISGGVLSGAGAVFLADEMPVIAIALAIMAAVAFGMAARRKATGDKRGCGGSCKHAPRAEGACGCAGTSE